MTYSLGDHMGDDLDFYDDLGPIISMRAKVWNDTKGELARLREALGEIAAGRPGEKYSYTWMQATARNALKEGG